MVVTTGTSPVPQLTDYQTLLEGLLSQSVVNFAAEQQAVSAPSMESLYTRPARGILGRKGLDVEQSASLYLAQPSVGAKLDRSMSLPPVITDKMPLPAGLNKNLNLERYKTEMCHQFRESGFCKYGAKCQFAHGSTEMRSVNRHPKYKSDMCRTYHSTGLCRYGIRCHFIHDEDEAKLVEQRRLMSRYGRHNMLAYRGTEQRHHSLPCDVMSLGSAGDTPPGSTSSSPAPSPTGFLTQPEYGYERRPSLPDFVPSVSAYLQRPETSVFTFPYTHPKPIGPPCSTVPEISPIASLAAGLQAAVHRRGSQSFVQDCLTDIYSLSAQQPATSTQPDDKLCDTPMDISRNLRLSVFTHLSNN